jgi:hypothetical protein
MRATRVVNLRAEPFDVYVGRAGKGQDGYFGNPHKRDEGLGSFRSYFLTRLARDAEFKRRVEELRGKVLGCFCKPGPCHGDVIVEWLDATAPTDEDFEERAAILEFDAGMSRADAERRARELAGGRP